MKEPYKYRILKSSWGIAIDLLASSSTNKAVPAMAVQAAHGLWLNVVAKHCSVSDKAAILNGLRKIAGPIKASLPHLHHDIVITVEEVDYTPTDFQEEGLTCAIIKWAEQEFGLTTNKIDVTFNKTANKYEFDFSKLPV